MPMRFPHASFVILFGLAATGCAAPVKALMQLASPQAADETPAPAAGEAAKTPLQQALEKRAAALRDPVRPASSPRIVSAARPERLPSGRIEPQPIAGGAKPQSQPNARVLDMLARVKSLPETRAKAAPANRAAPLEPSSLSMAFHVKSEERVSSASATSGASPASAAHAPRIRFAAKSTLLDADGNRALASLVEQTGGKLGYRLRVIGGFTGEGQLWERMNLAAARIETVANHVPPPLIVERGFDPAMPMSEVRLELIRDRR